MGTAKTTAEDRNFYLKTVMAYRKVTARRLSEMTGISQRTLERHTSGRTDIAEADGLNVAMISYVLSADAYVLGGIFFEIFLRIPFESDKRTKKKQTVIGKLKAFFEKYFGLGVNSFTDAA